MSDTSQLREQALPGAGGGVAEELPARAWQKARLILIRSIFWSYERGTWQYDTIVLVILVFIFLTPRAWYRDQPTLQLTDLRHNQGVVEVRRDKDGRRYMIDARLVESRAPMNRDDAIDEILHRRLQKPFTVKSIDPIRDRNNVVLGYTVVVSQ